MLWVLFFRPLEVPFGIKLISVIAYVTVPVFFAVKGTQSAVYLSDLALPFLLIALLSRGKVPEIFSNHVFVWLMMLLIILPIVFGLTYMSGDDGASGFGARDVKGDLIWLYRNATYLLLFGYALTARLTVEQFIGFIKINIVLALILALMGLLNYFGPLNLAFFDQLNNQQAFKEDYGASRIGTGFMGLFRGSIGQWFASVVVLSVGAYSSLSSLYRKIAIIVVILGVGMILLSYSRAGLVGACLGLALLGLFGSGFKQRFTALIGIGAVTGWIIWQSGEVLRRVSTIYTGESEAGGRIGAWDRTIHYFENNQDAFLLGVGPTNREAVAHIAGTYGAHNEYLDVVFRFGITGLIVLLLVLTLIALNILRHRRLVVGTAALLLNTVFAVFLINCVIGITQNHLMQDYSNYTMGYFLYLFYGLALGVRWQDSYPVEKVDDSITRICDVRSVQPQARGFGLPGIPEASRHV